MDAKTYISAPVSRRRFLAGAAASTLAPSILSRPAMSAFFSPAFLHLADHTSQTGCVHTYALTPDTCPFVGSTAVEALAASASHPTLPVLYVARDSGPWDHLPRGVVETYAVEYSARPLRLLAQTPMSLSATGPRSLAVSNCGKHLLVSAAKGGAWNAFSLGIDGIPVSPAIARKETGALLKSRTASLPTPHGLAFSPHTPYAIAADPGCERITLLQPSADGIAVLARCDAFLGLSHSSPAWTIDGAHIVATNARTASLSVYAVGAMPKNQDGVGIRLVDTADPATPIEAFLAHPTQPGVLTLRTERQGSCVEFWALHDNHLRVEQDAWTPNAARSLAHHAGTLWLVSEDRVVRMRLHDLRNIESWETRRTSAGVQAIITRSGSA